MAAKKTAEEVAPVGETFTMLVEIRGLRDGEPWPAVGEDVVLPAEEGAQYVALGYVAPAATPQE